MGRQSKMVAEVKLEVAFVVEAVEEAEVVVILVDNDILKVMYNVIIARNSVTRNPNVGANRRMIKRELTLQRMWMKRVSCSWLILQLLMLLMEYGMLIVDAQTICAVQKLYSRNLMRQRKGKFDSKTTSQCKLLEPGQFQSKPTLHNVQYVPSLAHNFLSVGQLLKGGYVVLFDDECCYISDK